MRNIGYLFSFIVPGIGQAINGRYVRSVALLIAAGVGLDMAILGAFLFSGDSAQKFTGIGLAVFGIAWLLSLVEMFHHKTTYDPRKLEPLLIQHLRNAQNYFLASKFDEAIDELKALLKKSPRDIEGRLYLAAVYVEMGERKKAMAQYAKVMALDENEKWKWQVNRDMKELNA